MGPTGPGHPTSIFEAVVSTPLTPMAVGTNVTVPFDLVTAGNADGAYNAAPYAYAYTAPASGLYAFTWVVTASIAPAVPLISSLVTGTLSVDGAAVDGVTETFSSSIGLQVHTLTGSSIVQLRAGQRVTVVATTQSGQPINIAGPSVAAVPPYQTRLTGMRLS